MITPFPRTEFLRVFNYYLRLLVIASDRRARWHKYSVFVATNLKYVYRKVNKLLAIIQDLLVVLLILCFWFAIPVKIYAS